MVTGSRRRWYARSWGAATGCDSVVVRRVAKRQPIAYGGRTGALGTAGAGGHIPTRPSSERGTRNCGFTHYCVAVTAPTSISVAALVRDGRVLLVHRHPSRQWYPDCWDLVGGHIEANESPRQAIIRECLEELGVQIHDPFVIPFAFSDPTLDMHAFLVTRWDGRLDNAAPDEHDDLRWFPPHALPDLKMADPASLSSILSAIEATTQ